MVNLRTITIKDMMNEVSKKMEVVIAFKDMGPRMPEKKAVAAATVAQKLGTFTLYGAADL